MMNVKQNIKTMPELILKFNLPEEQSEADTTLAANRLFITLWDLKQELRNKIKYGEYSDKEYKLLEEIEEFLNDAIHNNNVSQLFQ